MVMAMMNVIEKNFFLLTCYVLYVHDLVFGLLNF
jgi:hypothetical protein